MSRDLWGLISLLLIKDPQQRATWEGVRKHPFWEAQLEAYVIPEEPLKTKFMASSAYRGMFFTQAETCPVSRQQTHFSKLLRVLLQILVKYASEI